MKSTSIHFHILIAAIALLILSACGSADSSPAPTHPVLSPTPEPTSLPSEAGSSSGENILGEVVPTRTPVPTVTPGVMEERVAEMATQMGMAEETFLGLEVEDWLNLTLSLLLIFIGYIVGTWLIRRILPKAVRRTAFDIDDRLLEIAGSDVRWLVVVLALQFSTIRLTFVATELKTFLSDVYFSVGLFFVLRIIWRLIELLDHYASERAVETGREDELLPLITLLVQVGRVVIVVAGVSILLSHYGVDVTAFAAAMGIGGLAISFAAKDTVADAISGFIILMDRPFRVGDRIEIKGADTWGDVVKIGLRTTSIRTRDNRMVIVPNSTIGKNEVINYTYPDPRYRIQTHIGIGYDTSLEFVTKLIYDTVRQVDGVLPNKPVDVLYHEMGDSAMIFRVRWWIPSYVDTRRVIDRVHRALQDALDAAEVDRPFPTQAMNLQIDPQNAARFWQASRNPDESGRSSGDDEPPSSFHTE